MILVIIQLSQKNYNDSNRLALEKMKDETRGAAIEEIVGLKSKILSFLVENSEYEKAKDVNRNIVAKITHNEYKE